MLSAVIRREHKSRWEQRTPLNPQAMGQLLQQNHRIAVERSPVRIYPDIDYQQQGAQLIDHQNVNCVLGIKEPKIESIQPGQVHLAFSHTHKGQEYNRPLLQRFVDQKATLIDYELITDDTGKRTIAFGRYAGIAGAIDTLATAGQKLSLQQQQTALSNIQFTHHYGDIAAAKKAFAQLNLSAESLGIMIVGSGNVGQGAIEVMQWLNIPQIAITDVLNDNKPQGIWFTVASTEHVIQSKTGAPFDFADYIEHGSATYESSFEQFLGKFDVLLHTPYWEEKYPKLLSREVMLAQQDKLPLVVGDITCDIDGSLACTQKPATIDHPVYSYDVASGAITDGIHADGISVMAIDNLPCELSRDASDHFSAILQDYIPSLLAMDCQQDFAQLTLHADLKRAMIVYCGQLTPDFNYLQTFLEQQ